jgi:hypothetical protein
LPSTKWRWTGIVENHAPTFSFDKSGRPAWRDGNGVSTHAHDTGEDLTWFLRKAGLLELLEAVFGMIVKSGPVDRKSDSEGGILATAIKRSSVNGTGGEVICKIRRKWGVVDAAKDLGQFMVRGRKAALNCDRGESDALRTCWVNPHVDHLKKEILINK